MNKDEALRKAEAIGAKLAKRLMAKRPRRGSTWYRTWQINTAWEVSNIVARSWLKLSDYQFREEDDYSVLIDGKPVTVEVKGSLTQRDSPWPVSKGMGGWQRERRRAAIAKGSSIVLLQVAIKADASVRAAAIPLTLVNVLRGKDTVNYKRNVAYFLDYSFGKKRLNELLGAQWSSDEV